MSNKVSTCEIIDIKDVIDRWDEILNRTEAGENFVISVEGIPKVRLEPIPPGERPLEVI